MNAALAEELIVIESIYPGRVALVNGSTSTCSVNDSNESTLLYLTFDADYPDTSPNISGVSGQDKQKYQDIINDCLGVEVLFAILSSLEQTEQSDDQQSTISVTPVQHNIDWAISDPLQDRKSTFIGRACTVTSDADIQAALDSVDAKRAHHPKIWACRYTDINGRLIQSNDDDGETAAGGRLAFLLDVTKSENVLVVVSRWFGGTLLGDIRFKHISTVAREALDRGGYLDAASSKTGRHK